MFERFQSFIGLGRKNFTMANPSPEMLALFGAGPTASGATVSVESAMRCPAFLCAVKILSESVAQIPLILYRRGANGDKSRAEDHPLYELLHDQPNAWTSAFEFRLQMQAAVTARGNAFAYIGRSGNKIVELVQLKNDAVAVETDDVTLEPRYRVQLSRGGEKVYAYGDILHLRSLGTCPNEGASTVTLGREAIGLTLAMEMHAAKIFGNGAKPSGVLKYGKPLGPEAIKRLKESFDSQHRGERAGGTLVLEDGMDWTQTQFTSVESQFLELRKFQLQEIARMFRIPPHLLGDLDRATFSNIENQGQAFLSLTLMPWLKMWEGAIRRSLLSPEERKNFYAEFLTDDLARADLASRYTAYAQAVTNGILNPNEVRAMENRAPYQGGDQFRLPMNTEDAAKPAPSKPRLAA